MSRGSFGTPYPGPLSYGADQTELFRGRRAETRELLAYTIAEPVTLVHGRTGVGKSSLLRAGLSPALGAEHLDEGWIVRIGDGPSADLGSFASPLSAHLLATLHPELPVDAFRRETLSSFLGGRPVPPDLKVLVIDQMEEIFRWQAEDAERHRADLFRDLRSLSLQVPNLHVILSFRDDFLPDVASLEPILGAESRPRQRIVGIDREGAIEAVREPAAREGRPFAPGVAEALVDRVRSDREHVDLFLLQVACVVLWKHVGEELDQKESPVDAASSPEGLIELKDLQRLGDLNRILERFLGIAFERAAQDQAGQPVSGATLRGWALDELVARGRYRRRAAEDDLGESKHRAFDALASFGVVQRGRSQYENKHWYELAHDRLVDVLVDGPPSGAKKEAGGD